MTERFIGLYPCICPKKQHTEWGPGGEPSLLPALRRLITIEEPVIMRMMADKKGGSNVFGGGRTERRRNGPVRNRTRTADASVSRTARDMDSGPAGTVGHRGQWAGFPRPHRPPPARPLRPSRPGTLGYAEAMILAYNVKNKRFLSMKRLYWNGKGQLPDDEEPEEVAM